MKNLFKTIKRYLKVYGIILKLNLGTLFAYRANFFNSVLSNSVWAIFIILSMVLLTSKSSTVFGWTRNELLMLAGVYNILFSIFYFLFSRNFSEFSNNIHYGRLDAMLSKPIDSQFMMTCMFVSYTHIFRFALGTGFVIYILNQMHMQISLFSILGFILFICLSVIILYSLWMLVMTLTIWYTKLSNLVEFLYESHNVSKYPQEIYKGGSIYAYFLLFPLTLVVVMPSKILLQKITLIDLFWPFLFAALLFFLSRKFWRYALRSYTSASG